MTGRGVLALGGLVGLLCLAAAPGGKAFSPDYAGGNVSSLEPSMAWPVADSSGMTPNPHSDLIFRATGAATCLIVIVPEKTACCCRRLGQSIGAGTQGQGEGHSRAWAFRGLFALSCRRQQGVEKYRQ